MTSALHSHYVIDGIPQELTPAEMLDVCLETVVPGDSGEGGIIVDETVDAGVKSVALDPDKVDEYLELCLSGESSFPMAFPDSYTRGRAADALIDSIWRQGRFRLDDLVLTAKWTWNQDRMGNMAALYDSVEAAAEYIDGLGVKLRRYSVTEGEPSLKFATPFSGAAGIKPFTIDPDPQSWLIYVPFDTCDYRLGGSMLAQRLGLTGGAAPQIADTDYFADCYEVVRELVEDGIIVSGATVGEGGLLTALMRMCPETGADVDVSDLSRACRESNIVRVLFSEVPGVVFQIRDIDYDYIDAELLLQDVVFFPLGHPVPGTTGVHVRSSEKTGLQTILESLIRNQGAEGED